MVFFYMPNIRKHSHDVFHKGILLSWDARIERFSQRHKCWLRCPVVSTESEEKVAEIMISFHHKVMPPWLRRFAVGRNLFDCSIAETMQKHAKREEIIIVWVVCGDSTGFYSVIRYPKPLSSNLHFKISWPTGCRSRNHDPMITQALVLAVVVVAVAELGVAERQQLTKRLMPQALRWSQGGFKHFWCPSRRIPSIHYINSIVFLYCKLPLKLEKHNQSIALFILVLYRESYDLWL